ncbi:MAG: DUF1553 domain-containing protein [Acidobacteria bacterium]|nr:DUF1553 domain-containing protein [Acidobacteriota bacterium]
MFRFAILAWGVVALLAQPNLPKDHPALKTPGKREEASRLTDQVAGPAAGKAAPVPRRNFIDQHIFGKMERDRIPHAGLSSDQEFFRRLHLDLTGRIPDSEDLEKFLASTDPGKRDKLIDSILGSGPYLAKWTYWFGDLGEINANRIGNEGKNLFYRWSYDNLHMNRPYNEMVAELMTPTALSNWFIGPASYLARWVVIGDNCADTVHEDTSDDIAIHAAKHFLGVNLQCVSCHDGRGHLEKLNLWLAQRKRREVWETAAFFGKTRLLRRVEIETTRDEYSIDDRGSGYEARARTVVRIPRGGKGLIEPAFFLNGARPEAGQPLRQEFARLLTGDPQFARASVNLFWAELMGVGIVDPPWDFDLLRLDPKNPPPAPWTLQPTHPELLEALASDFRQHNHDLRRLFRLITQSGAYQLSSRFPGEWKDSYARYYARKFVRRLKAEEIYDSLAKATGLYTEIPIRGTDLKVRYATETRSPEDFKQRGEAFKDINFFLEIFGQTNREYSERKNEGSITQAVLLLNGPLVSSRTKAAPGSYLAKLLDQQPSLNDDQIVNKLYQRFLVRSAAPAEIAMARDLLRPDRRKGFEDLQWILVNKVEFLFNY